MVQSSGDHKQLTPMHRDTLLASVVKCLDHREDTAIVEASALCDTIVQLLLKSKPLQPTLSTHSIATQTYAVLQRYDKIAAIKYRSYREMLFTDKGPLRKTHTGA